MPPLPAAVLIYDGACVYCRQFARVAQRLGGGRLRILPFQEADARALLQAQFGAQTGFTLYLFKREEVHWAQAAARETATHLGMTRWMAWAAFQAYPALVRVISFLTRRRQAVCMPGSAACSAAQVAAGGSVGLTPLAVARLCALGQ